MNALKGVILGCLICIVPANVAAQTKGAVNRAVQSDGMSADKLVSLGDFASRSNDVSDSADRYYQEAIKNAPRSQAAGVAQYNRGAYWFRKYYVVKEQFSKEDPAALTAAEGQFYDFIDKFARPTNTIQLLSDAEFNLAMVYLQQGKRNYATGWLNRMISEAVKDDKTVRIYKVVWSSNVADIIDRDVDSEQLAVFTRQSIEKGLAFNEVVSEVKRWCKQQ
jgi:tetratricopeptide (TPR) repeat protein